MIVRSWKGRTSPDNADPYLEFLRTVLEPELRAIQGFVEITILRRSIPDGFEFCVQTHWVSHDAIRAFAGDSPDLALIPTAARALLSEFDPNVVHYEVMAQER